MITPETKRRVSFGAVIGVTANGVPVFSNGEAAFFSQQISLSPSLRSVQCVTPTVATGTYDTLGYMWLCMEFVRRYLIMTKGLWLVSLPTAEDIWETDDIVTTIPSGAHVEVSREVSGETTTMPLVGDLMIWRRTRETPYGHVAVVVQVSENWVRVAEQNYGHNQWVSEENYSRQIERCLRDDGIIEFVDECFLLGWINIRAPLYDFSSGDLPDQYRHILSSGYILRHPLEREVTLPWLNPFERCDYFLKRSLTTNKHIGEDVQTKEHNDVPDGYYLMDYDVWCRFRYAVNTLHKIAMEATRCILDSPDLESLLVQYFSIPKELHQQLRRSFERNPPMFGRFDFGYNGKDIIMLEYNCDFPSLILECGDTQEKMAHHYGVTVGTSTGSFLYAKIVNYFGCLIENGFVCPSHKLIHFMIDDDDVERYTALYVMEAAKSVGFRTKLCVALTDFRYAELSSETVGDFSLPCHRSIVDLENEEVLLVWKTWSWDMVLRQYAEQHNQVEITKLYPKPSLSDILLNERIHVIEPFWKVVTGSNAILPFMYAAVPNHPNMVPVSFQRTREMPSGHYLSRPANSRVGKDVTIYDFENENDNDHDDGANSVALSTLDVPVLGKPISAFFDMDGPANTPCISIDKVHKNSTRGFCGSSIIYQSRVFLSQYNNYFPIFCGWNIGGEFGGIVIRESTSNIPKHSGLVVPARVVRENISFDIAQKESTTATYIGGRFD